MDYRLHFSTIKTLTQPCVFSSRISQYSRAFPVAGLWLSPSSSTRCLWFTESDYRKLHRWNRMSCRWSPSCRVLGLAFIYSGNVLDLWPGFGFIEKSFEITVGDRWITKPFHRRRPGGSLHGNTCIKSWGDRTSHDHPCSTDRYTSSHSMRAHPLAQRSYLLNLRAKESIITFLDSFFLLFFFDSFFFLFQNEWLRFEVAQTHW